MKYILLSCLVVLCLASLGIYSSYPDLQSDVPVIYWVTDPNPARIAQVDLFHKWLVKNGYTTEDGKPVCELRTDSANRDLSKKIIQGVSGVGGDVMDLGPLHYFVDIGLLEDVTESGKELGFSPDHTYPAIVPDLTVGDKQYAFPCNVYATMLWVNNETFRKYGITPPSGRWSFDEFEQVGKELNAKANKPGQRREVYLAPYIQTNFIHRSQGLSMYNETLTACTLDDSRYVDAMKLKYKWMYEDHILPTAADQASFDTESGYGGSTLQLFYRGNYATFMMGRYALIQLRKFGAMDLGLAEPPNGGFPYSQTGTRCAGVYFGGQNKEYAKLFLAFLASEDYNLQVVRDADALPPNPKYTKLEEFSHPPEFPNEWSVHDQFAKAMDEIAIPVSQSPFVLQNVADRHVKNAEQGFMQERPRLTAEEAAKEACERVNAEIQRSLEENPKLLPRYEQLCKQQKEIEQLRAANQPVPLSLIKNPFHRKYYQFMGWAKTDGE